MKPILRTIMIVGFGLFLLHIPVALVRFSQHDTLGSFAGWMLTASLLMIFIPVVLLSIASLLSMPGNVWREIKSFVKYGM